MKIYKAKDYADMSRKAANDKVIQKLGGVDMQLHNDVTVVADTAALSFIKG